MFCGKQTVWKLKGFSARILFVRFSKVSDLAAAGSSGLPELQSGGLPGTEACCPRWKHSPGSAERLCNALPTSSGLHFPLGRLWVKPRGKKRQRRFRINAWTSRATTPSSTQKNHKRGCNVMTKLWQENKPMERHHLSQVNNYIWIKRNQAG